MIAAAQRDRADVVSFLLALGVSPEVEDRQGQRALNAAAGSKALRVAALLLERGVEVDHRESRWGATPLAWAVYGMDRAMIDLLTPHTRDVWNLTFAGKLERLRELLDAEPALAKAAHPDGDTPLTRLPDDEGVALRIIELFLAHGADPSVRNEDGTSAADLARKRGMEEAAERLGQASREGR
jgi:ankyrin repeat protein